MNKNLTKELKDRFFASYWGKKVLKTPLYLDKLLQVDHFTLRSVDEDYLLLRHISSLTDKEILQLCQYGYSTPFKGNCPPESWKVERNEKYANVINRNNAYLFSVSIDDNMPLVDLYEDRELSNSFVESSAVDYLRSIEVAVEFNGVWVETQLKEGWIKIRQ